MQHKNIKQPRPKQLRKNMDERLSLLQKSITSKISKTKDENLVKLYLQQVQKISQQRLTIQKEGG